MRLKRLTRAQPHVATHKDCQERQVHRHSPRARTGIQEHYKPENRSGVVTMLEPTRDKQIGGTSGHVSDCYVWAEIYYLDSSTNYRECLSSLSGQAMFPDSELVMSDDKRPTGSTSVLVKLLVACLALAVCVILVLWGWWGYSREKSNPSAFVAPVRSADASLHR